MNLSWDFEVGIFSTLSNRIDLKIADGDASADSVWNMLSSVLESKIENDELTSGEAAKLRDDVRSHIQTTIDRHLRDQRTWTTPTSRERLVNAFLELEDNGILAQDGVHWTDSEARGSMRHQARTQEEHGAEPAVGIVYFTLQSAQYAVGGGSVMLGYEGFDDAVVGQRVVDTLREHDLDVTWNGDTSEKIEVAVDWRRRLPEPGADASAPGLVEVEIEAMGTLWGDHVMRPEVAFDIVQQGRWHRESRGWLRATVQSGGCIQLAWNKNELSLDSPNGKRVGEGLEDPYWHVTLDQVKQALWVVAHEDRRPLAELGEPLGDKIS
ncbi:hypothetical protein NE857_32055 [Nocardiopsis exhalans]|uniref:DUF6891 domain-containing protein n=1 Tax=Nocardiopsis exhalans TaxID=163604 RepID=A0ABY5D9P1_9ACTN|nr:hypothetical protein [Nocardiopsis exhalans]USY19811.1 hypothetical protein NE857_32055 [Nocardiopsis exhalans]